MDLDQRGPPERVPLTLPLKNWPVALHDDLRKLRSAFQRRSQKPLSSSRICITAGLLAMMTAACFAFVQPVRVEGTAMLPALKDGDRIIVERNPKKLDRGDIVLFYFPLEPSKSYIKRIVGLPNETVEIREGKVFINGRFVEEPYVDPRLNLSSRSLREIQLNEDSYFVIGDNRDNSSDSRIWGPLQRKFIYGKYMTRYF